MTLGDFRQRSDAIAEAFTGGLGCLYALWSRRTDAAAPWLAIWHVEELEWALAELRRPATKSGVRHAFSPGQLEPSRLRFLKKMLRQWETGTAVPQRMATIAGECLRALLGAPPDELEAAVRRLAKTDPLTNALQRGIAAITAVWEDDARLLPVDAVTRTIDQLERLLSEMPAATCARHGLRMDDETAPRLARLRRALAGWENGAAERDDLRALAGACLEGLIPPR